jgi:hypothetical protein
MDPSYCNAQTKSEVHVLVECQGLDDLLARRASFLAQVGAFPDGMTALQCLTRPLEAIHYFLEHDSLAPAFAYDVFFMSPSKW